MSSPKKVIEFNGKRYDAQTGELINHKSTHHKTQAGVVDGFVRRPISHAPATHKKREVQKSKALMRPAVKKPAKPVKHESTKAKLQKDHAQDEVHLKRRLEHAQKIAKSNFISRFGVVEKSNHVHKKTTSLPVVKPKVHEHKVSYAAAHGGHGGGTTLESFEKSIATATSHLTEYSAKKTRKFALKNKKLSMGAATLSVLLLVGFFGYQNLPNLEMRMAATRAGFAASMPSYKPAGYGVAGPVQNDSGKISVSFKSRTDDKTFKISQQASNWSSDALLANYVTNNSEGYQVAHQSNGKTVYLYDESSATWVDGGVWYQIEGNASLTSDQLLRIVNSF